MREKAAAPIPIRCLPHRERQAYSQCTNTSETDRPYQGLLRVLHPRMLRMLRMLRGLLTRTSSSRLSLCKIRVTFLFLCVPTSNSHQRQVGKSAWFLSDNMEFDSGFLQ